MDSKRFLVLFILGLWFCSLQAQPERGRETFKRKDFALTDSMDRVGSRDYWVHRVDSGQTMYAICKAYKCSYDEVYKFSEDKVVQIGEVLYIASHRSLKNSLFQVQDTTYRAVLYQNINQEDSLTHSFADTLPPLTYEERAAVDSFRISMVIPLFLEDSLDKRKQTYYPYYLGFLEAFFEFNDTNVFLKVFDVTKDFNSLDSCLQDDYFQKSNLIISLSFTDIFDSLSKFSHIHKIPIIHALTERDTVAVGNPYYIQMHPSLHTQLLKIHDYLEQNLDSLTNLMILSDHYMSNKKIASALFARQKPRFTNEFVYCHHLSANKQVFLDSNDKNFAVDTLLYKQNPTLVCAFIEKEITLMNTLVRWKKELNTARFFGAGSWLNFNKVDLDDFKRIDLTVYDPLYPTVSFSRKKEIDLKFFRHFSMLPNDLAYQGYNLGQWILYWIRKYNADFMPHITEEMPEDFLIYPYEFVPRPLGGYENQRLVFKKFNEIIKEKESTLPAVEE